MIGPKCWACNDTGWQIDPERSQPPYTTVYVLCDCRIIVIPLVILPVVQTIGGASWRP